MQGALETKGSELSQGALKNKKSSVLVCDYQLGSGEGQERRPSFFSLIDGEEASIGPYQFKKPLGEGVFGHVRLFQCQQCPDENMAVKHLSKIDKASVKAFKQEQKLFQKAYPGEAIYFVRGDEVKDCRIVGPYFPGQSLLNAMKTHVNSRDQLNRLVLSIVIELSGIHQQGVVHGDVKPDNIIVNKLKNGEWQVRFVDFGHSSEMHDYAIMTDDANCKYYAPERILTEKNDKFVLAEPSQDLFSLAYTVGYILKEAKKYYLLTGALAKLVTQSGSSCFDKRPTLKKWVETLLAEQGLKHEVFVKAALKGQDYLNVLWHAPEKLVHRAPQFASGGGGGGNEFSTPSQARLDTFSEILSLLDMYGLLTRSNIEKVLRHFQQVSSHIGRLCHLACLGERVLQTILDHPVELFHIFNQFDEFRFTKQIYLVEALNSPVKLDRSINTLQELNLFDKSTLKALLQCGGNLDGAARLFLSQGFTAALKKTSDRNKKNIAKDLCEDLLFSNVDIGRMYKTAVRAMSHHTNPLRRRQNITNSRPNTRWTSAYTAAFEYFEKARRVLGISEEERDRVLTAPPAKLGETCLTYHELSKQVYDSNSFDTPLESPRGVFGESV